MDTDVKNVSRVRRDQSDRAAVPHTATRHARPNNFGPRIGFNWAPATRRTSVHGGYGIYYDRITLQIQSLERGLDGRALPIEVRAGNMFFLDPATGQFPPFAPSMANPFTGFILPGAGASGINIIDNTLQNPTVQQFNLGVQRSCRRTSCCACDGMHNLGTHFIIGRTVGEVFNPVVGGPDRVVNLESSVNTHYDALLRQRRSPRRASRVPRVVHAGEGAQLRQRRSDPVQQRTDRSERPAARVRADAERSAASLHAGRRGRMRPADSSWRRSGRSRPACRWTS